MWSLSVLELINKHYSVKVLTIFLYIFISETSKCHMCKFYRIKSNSLQAIQIVHELFDCPSYI